jgi:hypothetical protein
MCRNQKCDQFLDIHLFLVLQTVQEGSMLVEQRTNAQGQPFFPRDANTLPTHLVMLPGAQNYASPRVVGLKHNAGFGGGGSELRASSCEAAAAAAVGGGSSGGLMSATTTVLSSRSNRREMMMMSPGSMSTFGVWSSVTCASPVGVAVRHHTPAKDWLAELESLYVKALFFSFLFVLLFCLPSVSSV